MGSSVRKAKLQLSEKLLRFPEKMICWGNTNLQAADYKYALKEAFAVNRPVKFIRWYHCFKVTVVECCVFSST